MLTIQLHTEIKVPKKNAGWRLSDEILINFKMIKSIFFVQVIIFFGVPFINIFKNDITKENIHIYDILAVL